MESIGIFTAALIALATVSPPPAPAESPAVQSGTPTPLREIGHVRVTTPLCRALLGDATHAVALETENDRLLGVAAETLRKIDFDANVIVKTRGREEIARQYAALRASAIAGRFDMKRFRTEAKTAPTAEQQANLLSFADALDGALHRQRDLADDLGRFVAYLDSHDPIDAKKHDDMLFEVIASYNDARQPLTIFDRRHDGPLAAVPDQLATTAQNAATELTQRAQPLSGDEDAAASRIDAAFERC